MSGVEARETVEAAVRRELFGPTDGEQPQGRPLDCASGVVRFAAKEDSYGPFHDQDTGQEVLSQADPLHRYGIGILHPGIKSGSDAGESNSSSDNDNVDDVDISYVIGIGQQSDPVADEPTNVDDRLAKNATVLEDDGDDFDLTDANKFKPSAMAISFKCKLEQAGSLAVTVQGAYYDRISAFLPGYTKPFDWWVRRPFVINGSVDQSTLRLDRKLVSVQTAPVAETALPRIEPTANIFVRPVPGESDETLRLVTIAVSNTTPGSGSDSSFFQVRFSVRAEGDVTFASYPEESRERRDIEEQSLDLLYRHRLTYAIGHGCAANWVEANDGTVTQIMADPMPAYEVPSLTPDIFVPSGTGRRQPVNVSMRDLALGNTNGVQQVEQILGLYDQWIRDRDAEAATLPEQFHDAAHRHIGLCADALTRMRTGWALVTGDRDSVAAKAFRWANEAMLYQQLRSATLPIRPLERQKDGILKPIGAYPRLDPLSTVAIPEGRGNWRPFQIAFLLATLPELINPQSAYRETVDLIFFPTGGGKTEAYLGAAAVSLLARRLRDPDDAGTDTIMRYTLRLLTAQQFLRAASLICVLEDIRSKNETELGGKPFGIGVWLGGSSTPNTWKQATDVLSAMQRDPYAQNKFLLLRCPWCGAEMGPKKRTNSRIDVAGYYRVGQKVVLRCPDHDCRFAGRSGLPVHVVDDDIYSVRPSLIIGTVDKFAMLAWRPAARSLFGLGDNGTREASPPSLIIQDELHLISGPLGSMVGLYEPVIDDLCTDKRSTPPIPPKIIASTATARRYEEQILALYGRRRGNVAIFPPHGLEEGQSFFAAPATLDNGKPAPGRRYLGVFSASLGSIQTVQTRVAAATLQVARRIPEPDRDGYWTNLNFLNSLRELGNTVSLLQSDVPDYLTGLRRRDGLVDPRWPKVTIELTSRRRSDEIPKTIEQLQIPCTDSRCIDICLASNIIEVGVDIDRLALMTIVGQPKTTAQYIQASGRVGRHPEVSPGLVITIYGAAKPRDRSHFERFRTYHQRLYAQVEPTSVTPFASPVLKRALHAAIVAHIRQSGDRNLLPYPFPEQAYNETARLLRQRAADTDSATVPDVDDEIRLRERQWRSWTRTDWSANPFDGDPSEGLMRFAGSLPALDPRATIWDVPTSMRNVDAECNLKISLSYAQADGAAEEEGE